MKIYSIFLFNLLIHVDKGNVTYCLAATGGIVSLHCFIRISDEKRVLENLFNTYCLSPAFDPKIPFQDVDLRAIQSFVHVAQQFIVPSLEKPWTIQDHLEVVKSLTKLLKNVPKSSDTSVAPPEKRTRDQKEEEEAEGEKEMEEEMEEESKEK